MLTFALSKGRLADKIFDMLRKLELCDIKVDESDRRLVIESGNYRFFLAKPSDVPTFVESGVADLGVVGRDTLLEEMRDLTKLLDLGFGKCKMCVCGLVSDGDKYKYKTNLRVATKYPHIAKEYFDSINQNTTIIKLNGSVELGPIVGLSDCIVDIVESGRTLKENGLEVKEVICELSARLVCNNASLKTKYDEITNVVNGFKELVKE